MMISIKRLQLLLIFFILSTATWPAITGFPYQFSDCVDHDPFRKVSDLQRKPCRLTWEDQNTDQIQDVYKRFLFHYSKSQDSHHSVKSESHSVHPLMRLSPKLSQRRKKHFILMSR